MSHIAVIGSGFSGLSAACYLAKEGFDVTILEKNDSAGGRARQFKANGFTFDMGPSWYWMPDVFENFFAYFGKKASDYYTLQRLDPSYKIVYSEDDTLNIPAGVEALCEMFEKLEAGSGKRLQQFLEEGKFKYDIGINDLVHKPGLSVSEFFDFNLVKGALRLHVFQSISTYIRKFFKEKKLVQLLEFPVLFLGATPENTPALYSLMNYADMALGTWYPQGGMYKVIEGMVSLARSLNVTFEFSSNVEQVEVNSTEATGLVVNGTFRPFDFIIAGADYHHVEQHLLPASHRRYSEDYWQKRVLAPSSLIFYLGINKKLDGLLHHTLFFDQDFKQHATEIYEQPQWPSSPQFYISCPSKTDTTVAPEGCENIFILVPVAPDLNDTDAIREKYFDSIISRLEQLTGQSIREHIIYKRSYAHRNFIEDYNAFKGNAYGLANTLMQTANLKPSIINKKVRNLFYTGQLTVPGPGVPPSIISGEVVARELIKRHKELVN
ncbi:phytoene desaturase [Ohtaekwangia koreensis]|uniref:Phytoene desaturase n=2 Tax=Ohtaekwangia koreensis TaxID=688867 RepID=A0A1T5MEW1_9BACT|nr:phytoene desaturase [Ohtaekwangia koreensis]